MEQLHCLLIHFLFCREETGKSEHTLCSAVLVVVVKSDLNVIKHAHFLEQSYILECTGDTCTVYISCRFSCYVFTVKSDNTLRGLVYSCQHIEHGSLACAVRTDKSVKLALFD